MSSPKGCFKIAGFGCLGVILILVVTTAVTALVAKRSIEGQVIEEYVSGTIRSDAAGGPTAPAGPGRVVLDFSDGEFILMSAPEGKGVTISARYDSTSYRLVDELVTLDDGRWEYRIGFRRTIPMLQAIAMQIFGDAVDPKVEVFLPTDVELELDLDVSQCGFSADLGGLWLSEADIHFDKGGFELDVSEPLREPMDRLVIHGSMGGFEASGLGNASPAVLVIDCRMGGAEVDLRGEWLQDCDASVTVDMGGMALIVPRDIEVTGVTVTGSSQLREIIPREMPMPVLRLDVTQNRGEVEVVRR